LVSTGGEVATRFTFLSEQDALRVVQEEASKAGLRFEPNTKTLEDIEVPIASTYLPIEGPGDNQDQGARSAKKVPRTKRRPLVLDGTDVQKGISFEFVSGDDFKEWGGGISGSTLETYNMLGTARALRDGLDLGATSGAYGVFYDPLSPWVDRTPLPRGSYDRTTRIPANYARRLLAMRQHTADAGPRVGAPTGTGTLEYTPGSKRLVMDGVEVMMPVPAALRDAVAYLALEPIAKALGASVTWDEKQQVVTVSMGTVIERSLVWSVSFDGLDAKQTVAFDMWDSRAMGAGTREAAAEQLRGQVRDFIAWLKSQGVI
jgi:hypothetical protein